MRVSLICGRLSHRGLDFVVAGEGGSGAAMGALCLGPSLWMGGRF